MKKTISLKKMVSLLLITTLVFTTLVLTGCGGQKEPAASNNTDTEKPAEVITLKFADYYPVTHSLNKVVEYFIAKVEENSDGRIKVQRYPAEQLGKQGDMLPLLQAGTTDMAVVVISNFAGLLPLNTVMQLPYFTTAVEGTNIYNGLMETSPELNEEFKRNGVVPLCGFMTDQFQVGTVKKQVTKPEDLKGLKLSVAGGWLDKIAKQYGINAVSVPSPEVYESLQKNILDGNAMSPPSWQGYHIFELEKYMTKGLRMGASPATYCMNEKTWNELPEDLQKAVRDAAVDAANFMATNWDNDSNAVLERFAKEEGVTLTEIKTEDLARWMAPMEGFDQKWIEDMESKGAAGQKVWDDYTKLAEEFVGK